MIKLSFGNVKKFFFLVILFYDRENLFCQGIILFLPASVLIPDPTMHFSSKWILSFSIELISPYLIPV